VKKAKRLMIKLFLITSEQDSVPPGSPQPLDRKL
jgi:hypothetical protein